MSYSRHDRDPLDHAPVYIFDFNFGEGDEILYTDADEPVFFDFKRFDQEAVSISNLEETGEVTAQELKIKTSRDSELALRFVDFPPSSVVRVRVYEGHYHDMDREFKLLWGGYVLNMDIGDFESEFVCKPVSTAIQNLGLRRHYQKQCPHVLYGDECGAVKVGAPVSFESTSGFVSRILLDTDALPGPQEAFSGGLITWTENGRLQIRTVLSMEFSAGAADAILTGPGAETPEAEAILYMGCVHTEDSCSNWHGNIVNYGGQPWIPFTNPVNSITEYL